MAAAPHTHPGPRRRSRRWPALAAGAAACGLLAALWLGGGAAGSWPQAPGAAGAPAGAAAAAGARGAEAAGGPFPPPLVRLPGAPVDSFLARAELRHQLEELLLEAGEAASPEALKARLPALVLARFGPRDAARAQALLERYVDYRVALGAIGPPADAGDPLALRKAWEGRRALRERHFSPEEYEALFATDDQLDRYTLARLEIERASHLSAEHKALALRQAEQELPEAQRQLRTQATAHLAVAAQTAAFDAQGVTEHERHARRAAEHGADAAQRLAALDREERDWSRRLDAYAAARNAPAADPAALARLREQLFSREEQLRLDGALALRTQPATGGGTPATQQR